MKICDDAVIAFLLVVGLFFPTSVGGESRQSFIGIAFVLLAGSLLILTWRHGTRPGALLYVSLPILIVLTACTLIACTFRFGWGTLASYCALATIFVLNLKEVHAGRLVSITFFLANVFWVVCGAAVVFGNGWVAEFLTSWYSLFYSELVPGMMSLHKPVLTFGTHSLAGFFTYLFFWLNWERYTSRRIASNLIFAICELILLVALTSFTSFAFVILAITQIGHWLWKHSRGVLLASAAGIVLTLLLTRSVLAEQIESLWQNPEVASAVLNTENSGLLARYGAGGNLRGTVDYMWNHPFTPIGFTYPSFLFLGDSGPVQYLLRGSVPLLLLVYVGLYQFFRYNSPSRKYALTLFFIFLFFELGFDALPYFRTLFLLPFLVVYLKDVISTQSADRACKS